MAYAQSGDLNEAEQVLTEARERGLKILQDYDEVILDITSYLAATYRSGGQYPKAGALYQLVYTAMLNKDGANGDDLLQSKAALGMISLDLGEHNKSKKLLEEVLQESRQRYGDDHRYTAAAKQNFGVLHMELEEFEEAEPLLIEGRRILENVLGVTSSSSISAAMQLSDLYLKTDRVAEATKIFNLLNDAIDYAQPLDIHPRDRLGVLAGLALEKYKAFKYEEARAEMDELVKVSQLELGHDHEVTLTLRENLSVILTSIAKEDSKRLRANTDTQRLSFRVTFGVGVVWVILTDFVIGIIANFA